MRQHLYIAEIYDMHEHIYSVYVHLLNFSIVRAKKSSFEFPSF